MSHRLWDREDLVQRVLLALRVAERAVHVAAQDTGTPPEVSDRLPLGIRSEIRPLVRAKVVGESTLLIRTAAHLADLDDRVAAGLDGLARAVAPLARDEGVRTAICLEPGRALEHAFAHVLLTDAGYPDPELDRLLHHSAATAHRPERLPTRELEQEWLRRIHDPDAIVATSAVDRSCLARPLDALAASAHDHYSFTHSVLYASDAGRQQAQLPRPGAELAADAATALAASLDADHHDLTAELLWTWPMLGLEWTPAATFAFGVLTDVQDEYGFLPGPAFRDADRQSLPADVQDEYVLRSSYHTTLVMGMLCAAALVRGRRPACAVAPTVVPSGAADAVYGLLCERRPVARWQRMYETLPHRQQDGLGDLLVAVALRRARAAADLGFVRETLTVALRHGHVDAPAPRDAVALLRRTTALVVAAPDLGAARAVPAACAG